MTWDSDFHALLLNDVLRMKAYGRAIAEVVKPGMTVLDLGTGTGILALWALESGAKRVYGLDLNESILDDAVARIASAGYAGRFEPLHGLSYDLTLPEPVDLVVSEIMGNIADNEDFVPILADARSRLLKEGGKQMPMRVESYLVPVAAARAHAQLVRGECQPLGSAEKLADALASQQIASAFDCYYDCILTQASYLATPRILQSFALQGADEATYRRELSFAVQYAGRFTGFKGYFVADLSPSVALDISGEDLTRGTASASWRHCYLPIKRPVDLIQGDRITLSFSRRYPERKDTPFRQSYAWQGAVWREGQLLDSFHQEMRRG